MSNTPIKCEILFTISKATVQALVNDYYDRGYHLVKTHVLYYGSERLLLFFKEMPPR